MSCVSPTLEGLVIRVDKARTVSGSAARGDENPFPWRVFALLAAILLAVVSPWLTHRSSSPVLWTYSKAYLVFLIALLGGVAGGAAFLAWLVRRAPRNRQMVFALFLLAVPAGMVLFLEASLGWIHRDAFAWYRAWGHRRSALMGFEAAPNHRWTIAGATYTTDGNTFRVHPGSRPSPEDETLIVLAGGSAVFGYGLNDDETWAVRLERRLRETLGPNVTVLNAGCNGHNTLQQLIRVYLRVLPLKPDVVIQYGAINDVRPDREADRWIAFPSELVEARSVRDYLRLKNAGRGFYLENSLLINMLGRKLGWLGSDLAPRYRPEDSEEGAPTFDRTVALYLRNLDTLDRLCEAEGAVFIPVTFLADVKHLPPPYDRGVPLYVEALRRRRRAQGRPLIDLWPAFTKAKDPASLFFPDHYHPNRRGTTFLARHVADALLPLLRERDQGEAPGLDAPPSGPTASN